MPLKIMYFIVAEKPKFTEKLRFSTQNLTVNAKLSITNCWYSAPYEYAEKFWMKNGVKINTADNLNVVPQRRRKRRYMDPDVLPNLPKNSLSDFVIGKLSLADQGTYKCGVRGTDGVEYLSQEIYLGLQGKRNLSFITKELKWVTLFFYENNFTRFELAKI